MYQRQGRPKEALSQCERALELIEGCDNIQYACTVYKDMATIEQTQGQLDQAIEHLAKARDL